MADVLSQSEVESLLTALNPEDEARAAETANPPTGPPAAESFRHPVAVYDFKRPERISKDQIRVFHSLHEGFSRELGAALSGMLRSIVEVKLIGVDQLTYSEFVFSLENPTFFNLIEAGGLSGQIILDVNTAIVFPIVDRLLGGGKTSHIDMPRRALTDIETRLAARIVKLALAALENAWTNICALDLNVSQIESNPQLVQIVPPNEVVLLVSFELTLAENRGIMNLCIPYNTIEPLIGKLSSDTWANYGSRTVNPQQRVNLEAGVTNAPVQLVTLLAETTLTSRDVRNLEVGDVLLTEHRSDHELKVLIEGQPLFDGSAGVYHGRKAVRVGNRIAHPRDMIAARLAEADPVEERSTA